MNSSTPPTCADLARMEANFDLALTMAVRAGREFSIQVWVKDQLYGSKITMTRYGGCYEGGKWAAFLILPDDSSDAFGSDNECCEWWDAHATDPTVGVGATPDLALAALVGRLFQHFSGVFEVIS